MKLKLTLTKIKNMDIAQSILELLRTEILKIDSENKSIEGVLDFQDYRRAVKENDGRLDRVVLLPKALLYRDNFLSTFEVSPYPNQNEEENE